MRPRISIIGSVRPYVRMSVCPYVRPLPLRKNRRNRLKSLGYGSYISTNLLEHLRYIYSNEIEYLEGASLSYWSCFFFSLFLFFFHLSFFPSFFLSILVFPFHSSEHSPDILSERLSLHRVSLQNGKRIILPDAEDQETFKTPFILLKFESVVETGCLTNNGVPGRGSETVSMNVFPS